MEIIMEKFQLKQILENGVATVVFTKLDGTERQMKCTLLSEYLPVSDKQMLTEGKTHKQSDHSLSVWDIEKSAWRAFRLDSIKEVRT